MSIQGIFPIDLWDFETKSILADLPPEDLKLLVKHKVDKVYKKGDIIFREGSFPSGIFFIVSGKAKKYKLDGNGREHIIYVASAGELVGYHAVLAEERYPDSATTLEDSLISFISKEDFLFALQQSPVLNRKLLKTLSHEFAVLINGLTTIAKKSARERLALQLIVLREKYKTNVRGSAPVEINISREDLAALVGTARENVVRLLSDFKQEDILETKGRKIIIHNVKKLVKISGYEP